MIRFSTCMALSIGLGLLFGCDLLGTSTEPGFEGRLLPLAPGNHWSLVSAHADSSGPDTTRLRVLSTAEVNGRTYYALRGLTGEEAMLVRDGENGHVYWRREGTDVLWLDPSVRDDSTYAFGRFEVTVSTVDSVETPAGTFTNCLRFSFDIPEAADDEYSYTLKPGVGFVRRWGAWIGGWTLASYGAYPE